MVFEVAGGGDRFFGVVGSGGDGGSFVVILFFGVCGLILA